MIYNDPLFSNDSKLIFRDLGEHTRCCKCKKKLNEIVTHVKVGPLLQINATVTGSHKVELILERSYLESLWHSKPLQNNILVKYFIRKSASDHKLKISYSNTHYSSHKQYDGKIYNNIQNFLPVQL